jgi:RNA-binding protein
MKSLTPAQRQYLKGLAHGLQPVAMIGSNGLTPAVLKEIERGLAAHELIKIKAASDEAATRRAWLEEICSATGAQAVQQIGKVLVVYRAAAKPVIALPN